MNDYGNGPSTGLDQTAAGKVATGFCRDDLRITPEDRQVLRTLAERVAAIAASPAMAETRRLWTKLNRLERTRPLVFCDPENGWNEIITESQMQCRGKLARRWEMDLRKEIFWAEEMGDDKPLDPYFDVPYTVSPDDWGLQPVYHKTETLGSYVWDGAIKDYAADLKKLHSPRFEIDWETTNGCVEIARDVLGDLLPVRLKGVWWWSHGLTYLAATFRGLQNMLCDFVEHPDELKELLSIISRGHLDKLDYLESHGLLSLNNDSTYVGSGGFGLSDELPAAGPEKGGPEKGPEKGISPICRDQPAAGARPEGASHKLDLSPFPARTVDLWGFTESQETVHVSPAMYEEFVFPYERPIMERFGLTCYGCCEPLHGRWQAVRRHPHLRRVSCSPWVDVAKMAGYLEDKYVFSMKPNPAALAVPEPDLGAIRRGLRENLEQTRGCVVEIIMKDNHTLAHRPENATAWCRIAKEEAERIGG